VTVNEQVAVAQSSAVLLPVEITAAPSVVATTPSVQRSPAMPSAASSIDIELGGARVRVRGAVDEAALRSVLRLLRERA
jgi:transposase